MALFSGISIFISAKPLKIISQELTAYKDEDKRDKVKL
jgi:hypothetical protein